MPGNGVGDRVHNFFAQDNLSQGPRSQAVDGNWPLSDNLWAGSQKQFGVSDSSPRNYNPQQSETERGHGSQRVADPHLFNIAQTNARPEFAKNMAHREQPNSNGFMYGRQSFQTRPDEANFLGVETDYGRNNVNQRGFPFYDSQQEAVPEEPPKNPFRSESSEAHNSFDLFGGQHQMNSQYPGMMQQPLQQQQQQQQPQQPGFGDIQHLQQQLMLRKMQELQRQEHQRQELQRQEIHRQDIQRQELQRQEIQRQEMQRQEIQRQEDLRQLEARQQQNSLNQASAFARQASGSHAHGFINGIPTSDSPGSAWGEMASGNNTNWLQRASPAMQGPSSGLAFSPEQGQGQGQPQRSMGFVHQQQVDQSLYGVPVSGSRGPLNQYPHIPTDKAPVQHMPTFNNSFPGNHFAATPEQHMVHDGASVGKSLFGNTSAQRSSSGMKMDHMQQLKPPQNMSQDLFSPAEIIQDKSATEDASPHDAASLDPDEEKILFGSDDNIWEAFGSSKNMGGGVSSLLDDNEFAGGLPSSLNSGSWSALMQSAVAETTSEGAGVQEEWPDLNFQNPEPSSTKHPSTALGDMNLPNASVLNSGSVLADKHRSNMGFQHHGNNHPKQMNQHSSGGSNWLNRGAIQKADAEEKQMLRENSVGGEINAKGMPGHWTTQQFGTNQPNNKQNHWNVNESVPPAVNTGFNMNESDNSLQQAQSNDWKRVMQDETGQGDVRSSINPPLRLHPLGPAVMLNSSHFQGGAHHPNQFSPNNNHLNFWKHVDSSVKSKGSENSDRSQRRLNKGPQASESSFNSSDKEDVKMHEMESSRRENSNDSYRSSSSHIPNSVGLREKVTSDGGDSRSLPNQGGRKNSGPRKFQYHPMGNLDEDVGVPYGTRPGSNMKPMPLQQTRGFGVQEQGNFGHAKSSGQGYAPELEGVSKGSDDARFKGMIPGNMPNIFAPQERSVGLSTSDKASQPSQNMLELLHKVDQSRDRGIAKQMNSFERNMSSEMPEPENSDGSFGGHQRSQSSNSQGIGLQLGPPSQRLPLPNHASPRAMQQPLKPNPLSQAQASANSSGKSPFQETSQGESKNDRMNMSGQSASEASGHKLMTNFSAALGTDFPNSRTQLQNHQMVGARGQPNNGPTPQIKQADEVRGRSLSSGLFDNAAASSERVQPTQPRANSGMSQQGAFPKMSPNAWQNLPPQQLFSATQARKGQSNLSSSPQLNIVESTSVGQQNLEEQEAEKRRNSLPKFGATSLNSQGMTSGGEPLVKESNLSSEKAVAAGSDSINIPFADNPSASQRDIEAFGRSLKPNNLQSYSLLNQMKAMKNTDNDPNNRVLKRLKDSDNLSSGHQVAPWSGQPREHNNRLGDASVSHTPAPPAVSDTPKLTSQTDNIERNLSSLPSNASDQNGSQSGGKIEQSHISPQMAPSWFDQYGTFKTGQMSQKADAVRTLEHPFNIARVSGSLETKEQASAAADTTPAGVVWKTPVPSSMAVDQLSSPPLQTNASVQNAVVLISKKRKRPSAERHPWLKEVLGDFKNLHGICAASMEWCGATNRLMEKVDNDGEVIEGVFPVPKPKRRIILTAQLMQHLFPPPPATILSIDASSSYESVAFYAARRTLGDACNLVSSATSHSNSESNSLSDKNKESERMGDVHLSQLVEDSMSKANRLEDDFSRLDKKASILDLRVDFQDLEKFSVINRFAKFHGRGQSDGAEGSSSSDAAANTPKAFPQRYVIAVPLPKNLPERVQCLSL